MGSSAPPPPDYQGAAQQDQYGNHPNVQGPGGYQAWNQDPATGQWTLNMGFNPTQQNTYNTQQSAANVNAGIGAGLSGQIAQNAQNGIDYGSLPSWAATPYASGMQQTVSGSPIQQSVGLQNQYDFGGAPAMPESAQWANQQGIDAAMNQYESRLNPQWDQAYNRQRSELINQGIDPGNEIYGTQMDTFNRAQNDAYQSAMNSAVQQGAQIGSQMFGQGMAAHQQGANEAMAQGNFGNQAALQGGQFYNNAANQAFNQNMGQAQFANQTQQQAFQDAMLSANYQNQQHQQQLAEQMQAQWYPIQMQQALLGQQISNPQQVMGPQSNSNLAAAGAMGNYGLNANQQENQFWGDVFGGAGQLLGAGLPFLFSDKRLKKNIKRGAEVAPGIRSATWNWKGSGEKDSGVIAQDVEKVRPDMVREDPAGSGFKQVDYSFLFDRKFRKKKKGKG